MKIIKLLIWIVIAGLFGLVIFQNWDLFKTKESLGVNLFFREYQSPELPLALLVVFMFLFGWLVAYLSGLADRFAMSSRNKRLQQTINAQQTAIDAMRKDVEALKPKFEMPPASPPVADAAVEPPVAGDADTSRPPSDPPETH